jgi:hypothetical protein
MPIRYEGDTAVLHGLCTVEEAEPLLEFVRAVAGARVDATEVDHVHTAIVQVLMAARADVKHSFTDPVLIACLAMAPAEPQMYEVHP